MARLTRERHEIGSRRDVPEGEVGPFACCAGQGTSVGRGTRSTILRKGAGFEAEMCHDIAAPQAQ